LQGKKKAQEPLILQKNFIIDQSFNRGKRGEGKKRRYEKEEAGQRQ